MDFTYNTIQRFSAKIRYQLETYIDAYRLFVDNNVAQLQEYYTNPRAVIDVNNFNMLDTLIHQSVRVDNAIKANRNKFSKIDEWELATFLEDIKMKLGTYDNLGKWLRSAKAKNSWRSLSVEVDHTLGQGETLEQVAAGLGMNDEQDSWMQISIENNLLESDYTPEGGNTLRLARAQNVTPNFFLNSVIDNLNGEKLYGLDISRKLQFYDDDLLCLTYKETVSQAIDILITLKRGDIPEYPRMGRAADATKNVGTYMYSSLTRQLQEVFDTDDTLRNFTVTRFYFYEGDLYLEYSLNTFYNQTYNNVSAKLTN